MRKGLTLLLAILLLIPQASAAEDSTALRYGSEQAVYSIYASYEVEEAVTEVEVTFAEHVKSYAYANFAEGTLRISIASMNAIDLNKAVGWVTAKTADGRVLAPTLELTGLKFNGKAAACNLFVESVVADLDRDTLGVTVKASDHFLGSYTLVVAAYDGYGKLLASDVKPVNFREKQESFAAQLADCSEASCVKAFFLSLDWTPIAVAENCEISKS